MLYAAWIQVPPFLPETAEYLEDYAECIHSHIEVATSKDWKLSSWSDTWKKVGNSAIFCLRSGNILITLVPTALRKEMRCGK
jgi:hypothetical protein